MNLSRLRPYIVFPSLGNRPDGMRDLVFDPKGDSPNIQFHLELLKDLRIYRRDMPISDALRRVDSARHISRISKGAAARKIKRLLRRSGVAAA